MALVAPTAPGDNCPMPLVLALAHASRLGVMGCALYAFWERSDPGARATAGVDGRRRRLLFFLEGQWICVVWWALRSR